MTNENTSPYDICFGELYMRKHLTTKYPCQECGLSEDCNDLMTLHEKERHQNKRGRE